MMDEQAFAVFMKRNQRPDSVAKRSLQSVRRFEDFLRTQAKTIDLAETKDLEMFAKELGDARSVKGTMHGLRYYFEFVKNPEMARAASKIRSRYLQTKSMRLKDFLRIDVSDVERLEALGIRDADKMLESGRTEPLRRSLVRQAGVSYDVIVQLVKISDLSRIFGVKGVRARFYLDSGVDTMNKMAEMDPGKLMKVTSKFIKQTRFQGIPPTPKEAQYTIEAAKKLPKSVEYD